MLTHRIFLRAIITHGLRKVRFSLPEMAVSLIIMQIRHAGIAQKQDLFKNPKSNSHRHIYIVSIPTFSWSRINIGNI